MPTTELESRDVAELARDVREVAGAVSPADVFRQIHRTCRRVAPRSAIFLVRKDEVCGWNGHGHDGETLQSLRAFRARLDAAWTALAPNASFGQSPADESAWVAVEMTGRPIAFVLAERSGHERPWCPDALRLLATVCRLRLELDLAGRKLESATRRAPAPVAQTVAVAEPPAPEMLEPSTAEIDVAARAESPELEAARRYARLVATDIRLYHEEAVVLGQRNGDLVARLGDQLDLGKQTFLRRHANLGATGLEVLREAYISVLAAGKSELIPASVLA